MPRGQWKRSGWITEKPGVYELVDYICDRCGTRIGVEPWQAKDRDLMKRLLQTAACKCNVKA